MGVACQKIAWALHIEPMTASTRCLFLCIGSSFALGPWKKSRPTGRRLLKYAIIRVIIKAQIPVCPKAGRL